MPADNSSENTRTELGLWRRFRRAFVRVERTVMVRWIRFAHAHQDSHRLPIVMGILIYFDGFLMVIPSTIILLAAISISPARWILFATIFAGAATLNNLTTYVIGRLAPAKFIHWVIQTGNVQVFWEEAHQALQKYGPFGAFVGAIMGLPVQMITCIMGLNDAIILKEDPTASVRFMKAIGFALVGHVLKSFVISFLARFGWLKLEKKFSKSA